MRTTYHLGKHQATGQEHIRCLDCGTVSYSKEHIAKLYCPKCASYHVPANGNNQNTWNIGDTPNEEHAAIATAESHTAIISKLQRETLISGVKKMADGFTILQSELEKQLQIIEKQDERITELEHIVIAQDIDICQATDDIIDLDSLISKSIPGTN